MVGAPQCVRVLGPFRQAPAQQGSRDNHAAPDSTHRDGRMRGDRGEFGLMVVRGCERQRHREGGGHHKEKRRPRCPNGKGEKKKRKTEMRGVF